MARLKNLSNRNLWLLSFALAAILLAFTGFIFGMYLEDNEAIVAAINYGALGKMGSEQYFSNYLVFFLPILYKLSFIFTSLPVFGICKISFVWLVYASLIRFAFGELQRHNEFGKLNALIMLLLVIIVMSDSALHLHCIRHSILLSFAAFLLNYQSVQQYGKTSIAAVLIFLIAVIARIHSSAIMFAMFALFLFITRVPLKKIIQHYWIMGLIAVGFTVFYHLYGIYTPNMGKYIEAHYEYALIEKASLYPLSDMKNEKDSAKYEAVSKFFITDSIEMTVPFFDRVANIKYEKKSIITIESVTAAIEELERQSRVVFPVLLLLILPLAWWLNPELRKAGAWKTVALLFVAALVLFSLLLILVDDMKTRFYSPFSSMVVFAVLMFHLPLFLQRANKTTKIILLLILFFCGAWHLQNLFDTSKLEAQKETETQKHIRQLHAITSAHPTLMFMGSEIPFSSNPFFRSNPDLFPKLASFDGGYLIYYSYVQNRFHELFGISPVNYPALIELLKARKDIWFYITSERLEIVNHYFETVYHVKFNATPVSPKPELDLNASLYTVEVEQL